MCCFPIFFGFSLKTMSISSVLRHRASNGGKQTEITADMQFKLNNVKGQGASQAGTGPQVVRNPCFSHDCFALTNISQAIGSLNPEVPKSPSHQSQSVHAVLNTPFPGQSHQLQVTKSQIPIPPEYPKSSKSPSHQVPMKSPFQSPPSIQSHQVDVMITKSHSAGV